MSFQKLTYNGTKCNNYIYFSFEADYFDTKMVTKALNIVPTNIKLKRDPIPKSTSWKLQIDVGENIDLETPLEKLIQILEPKVSEIIRLKEDLLLETHLQFVINVDINPKTSTPFFPLNMKTISFLSKTETGVDFDLYKTDTIGILNNAK